MGGVGNEESSAAACLGHECHRVGLCRYWQNQGVVTKAGCGQRSNAQPSTAVVGTESWLLLGSRGTGHTCQGWHVSADGGGTECPYPASSSLPFSSPPLYSPARCKLSPPYNRPQLLDVLVAHCQGRLMLNQVKISLMVVAPPLPGLQGLSGRCPRGHLACSRLPPQAAVDEPPLHSAASAQASASSVCTGRACAGVAAAAGAEGICGARGAC